MQKSLAFLVSKFRTYICMNAEIKYYCFLVVIILGEVGIYIHSMYENWPFCIHICIFPFSLILLIHFGFWQKVILLISKCQEYIYIYFFEGFSDFYFKYDIFVLFLHKSYGKLEFPDCGNKVGADWMENLSWANTDPSMHFRETNTDLYMHFRKANTDLSMHFWKANTEFLLLSLVLTLLTISLPILLLLLLPIYSQHNYQLVTPQ